MHRMYMQEPPPPFHPELSYCYPPMLCPLVIVHCSSPLTLFTVIVKSLTFTFHTFIVNGSTFTLRTFIATSHVRLPMVYTDDLMRGLLSLQFAREDELQEPQRIYNMPGLSFTAKQLFDEIRHFKPGFEVTYGKTDANMDKFAKLWPNSLSTSESLRDLDYEPDVTLPAMVAGVLNAHSSRRLSSKAAFRSIDTCESGRVNDYMLEKFVRKYLVRGRERSGYVARRQDMVKGIVVELMVAMDVDKDGVVSMEDFLSWSNVNNLEAFVEEYYVERVARVERGLDELGLSWRKRGVPKMTQM